MAAAAVIIAAAACWHWRAPDRYFPAAEVDHVAAPLRRVDLEYPPGREGVDYFGALRMDLYIDAEGRVDRIEVVESTVPAAFRDSTVGTFRATRFEPASRNGRAVKSVKRVQVVFAPPPAAGVNSATSDR